MEEVHEIDPEGEEPPDGPDLPFRPTAGAGSGGSISTATFIQMAERFAPPPDDGMPADPHPDPNKPKPVPPTDLEIFNDLDPDPDRSGLSRAQQQQELAVFGARFRMRTKGLKLLRLGEPAEGERKSDRQAVLDMAAPAFRHNLAEFYTYLRDGLATQLEALDEDRHTGFLAAVAQDGGLTEALETWAERMSGDDHKWPEADTDLTNVVTELDNLKTALAAYDNTKIESVLRDVLDAIGREIARQTASYFRGGLIDLGGRYTGVTMATRLASPSRSAVDGFYQALTQEASQGGVTAVNQFSLSSQLLSCLAQANNAAKAAGQKEFFFVDTALALKGQATEKNTTPWVTNLLAAAEALGNESRGWQAGSDASSFATALSDLNKSLRAAGNEIINANDGKLAPGARRIVQRTLAALAVAVANRIDELAKSSIPANSILAPTAKKLRRDFSRDPITVKLSEYWATASEAALDKVTDAGERKSFTKQWFSDVDLGKALDNWSKQMGKVPDHDPVQLLTASWQITNTLNRYRIAAGKLSSADARVQLFDTLDDIAADVASKMDVAQGRYGSKL